MTVLRVKSPWGGDVVAELPFASGSEIDARLTRARATLVRWRDVPLAERAARVKEGVARFVARGSEIARDVTRQMGKPIVEARREVETFRERAEHLLSIAPDALAPEDLPRTGDLRRTIVHEPLGVVLDIAAWNYPLIIPVNVVVPALLAGNVVVLKHSGKTPLCGLAFEDAFRDPEYGDLVTHLVLTHEDTARLIDDRRIDAVSFTGSVEGGRSVYARAAARLLDVGLELGGKDPAYVASDADLDFAAANIVDGACYNAGQSCCGIERAYVHESVWDEFLARAARHLGEYRLGDPLREDTTLGPLASPGAPAFLAGQVEDAVRRGGRVVVGGRAPDLPGSFFLPTLVVDAPQEASIVAEESFGPVLPALRVAGDEEAVERMNDSRYGLTASVWTRDDERAERLARRIEAGTVFQNRCDYLDPALPWTGVKESGIGSTLSRWGFVQLTRRKALHFRTRR